MFVGEVHRCIREPRRLGVGDNGQDCEPVSVSTLARPSGSSNRDIG
jgi:hypothetical protein